MTSTIQQVDDLARGRDAAGQSEPAPAVLQRVAQLISARPPRSGALLMVHYERDGRDDVDWFAGALGLPAPAVAGTDASRYGSNGRLGDVTVHVLCSVSESPAAKRERLRRELAELDAQTGNGAS